MRLPVVAILLGVLSILFAIAGAVLTIIPFVGVTLSFLAPVLGIAGIVAGGVANSRAKRDGLESASAGLITSIVGTVIGVLGALTCGLCGACVSTAAVQNPDGFRLNGRPVFGDGGVGLGTPEMMEELRQMGREQTRLMFANEMAAVHASCVDGQPSSVFSRFSVPAEQLSALCAIPATTIAALRNPCASATAMDCTQSLPLTAADPAAAGQRDINECSRFVVREAATTTFVVCGQDWVGLSRVDAAPVEVPVEPEVEPTSPSDMN